MNISLDGYINDQAGSAERRYPDLAGLRQTGRMQAAIRTTGAVVRGHHAFGMGDPDWSAGKYEFQVPIFVLCEQPSKKPPKTAKAPMFTSVTTGIESGIEQARLAAGDEYATIIGGVGIAQQPFQASLWDKLQLGIVLGAGTRLFGGSGVVRIELEKLGTQDAAGTTYLRYRVLTRR